MKQVSKVVLVLSAAVACALTACGGGATGPRVPNVNGTWSLSLTNLSGSGISCSASGTTMNLTQTGATFSGSYSGGTFTCVGGGESFSTQLGTGSVIDGAIGGNSVSFELDSPDFPLAGTISGRSMSGTCTMRVDLGEPYGVITLAGNWGAAEQ